MLTKEKRTGDNENSTGVIEVNAASSYMALENDYSGFPNTPLYNIRVTAAHEFNHAIQFGYDVWEETWLMEATATWIEDEVYDNVNDNLQYLSDYFDYPDVAMSSGNPSLHWYGDWIFARYISEHHGGQSTIRGIWENSVSYDSYYGYYSFNAIVDALSDVDTSFTSVYSNFTVANYVMSTSPTNDPYCYEEASSYPSVYIEGNINYSGNTVNFTPSDGIGNYAADYISIDSTTEQAQITVNGASSGIIYAARVVGMLSGVPTVVDIPMSGSPQSGSVRISTASYDTVILIVENETADSSTTTQSSYSVQVSSPPSWESYKLGYPGDTGSQQEDYFDDSDTEHEVYMCGTGYSPGTYKAIYWDGDGDKRVGETGLEPTDGKLTSLYTFDPEQDTAGNWHATVYTGTANPLLYSASDPNIIADDISYIGGYAFYATESAIPEFPTILAAVVALALSTGIYLWMRRKVATARA